jgi:hypothetical protein
MATSRLTIGCLLVSACISGVSTADPGELTRLPIAMSMPCSGWLAVEEVGQDVSVDSDRGVQPSLPTARYGRLLIRVEIGKSVLLRAIGPGSGKAVVQALCTPAALRDLEHRADWLHSAQAQSAFVDQDLRIGPPAATVLRDLVESAPTNSDRAFAVHLAAQAALWREEYGLADSLYRQAHDAWLALGDRPRAGLAVLGLALALRTRSQFAAVPALADEAASLLPRDDLYFQARASEERCLAWHGLQLLQQARDCYAQVAAQHAALGEIDAELNTRYNQAFALRDLGNRADAAKVLQQAELRAQNFAVAQVKSKTRGQLALLRGMLAREDGEIGSALAALEAAANWFAQAPELGQNWQANALVRVAEIYGQLGLSDLAYRQLQSALALYQAAEAPGRIAGALMKLASIERAQQEPVRAAHWYQLAAVIYQRLQLPLELAEAELGRLENTLPQGRAGALALLQAPQPLLEALSAAEGPRYELLRARWLLLAEQWPQARQALAEVSRLPLSLALRIDAQALSAESLALEDPQAARAQLLAAIKHVHTEALAAGGALGFLTLRMARTLRAQWTRLALQAEVAPAEWLQTALASSATQALLPPATEQTAQPGEALTFGQSIAAEMLSGIDAIGSSANSVLLRQLVGAVATRKRDQGLARLRALQGAMPDDTWLLVLLPAEPQSAALWISAEQSVVLPLPGQRVLHELSSELLAKMDGPDRAYFQVSRAADGLSAALFAGAPAAAPPAALWVLADDSFTSLPLALLRWPGAADELIETTATSWVSAVDEQPIPRTAPISVTTLMADFAEPSAGTGEQRLQPLLAAADEPDIVAATLAPLVVEQRQHGDFSPAALRAALARPGAWVHIASHGSAQTGRLGYAGLWLPPETAGGVPQFVSWLDLIDQPLAADLVVLNACELAAAPSDVRQANVSFATAISALGVREVVAAHWALSDLAGALWIPTFYRALQRPESIDTAEALRLAQLTLKQSRHFRHPYYWASLGHFRRIEIPPAAAQP